MDQESLKIAVVGAGVAGITAAHVLQRRHQVTLFDRNSWIGGHTHTIAIPEGPDQGTPVDTGFIVLNDRTYPNFRRLLAQLGVSTRPAEMSFSYHDDQSGFHYAGNNLNGLFAQRRNIVSLRFWRLLRNTARFSREALRHLERNDIPAVTLGEYLRSGGFSEELISWYVIPMAAAIWSTAPGEITAFPAASFLRFFGNHGLLSLTDRPQWMTVCGGSHSYVKAFLAGFTGKVLPDTFVASVSRTNEGVRVRTADGEEQAFDRVVIAAHADEALSLLSDADDLERRLLGAWRYQQNRTVLHTDTSFLPPSRRAWASWNYLRERGGEADRPVSLTYSMNILQGLGTQRHYCVTLNQRQQIPAERIVADLLYTHPTYTFDSMATQRDLPSLNGRRNTFFCGGYFGWGFHEDAVTSGVKVARAFGLEL